MQTIERKASEETHLTHTLVSDLQPRGLGENKVLLFKPPALWHFVLAHQQTQTIRAHC